MYLSNTRFLPGQTLWKFGPIPNSFLFEAKFWARAQRNTSHGIWMYVWKLPQVSWANAAVEFNERLFSFSTPYTHSQIQGATFMLSSDSDHHGSSRFSTYPLSFPLLCYRAGSPSTLWTRWRTSCAWRCPSSSPSYSSSCSTLGSSLVGVITGSILLSLQHLQNSESPGTGSGWSPFRPTSPPLLCAGRPPWRPAAAVHLLGRTFPLLLPRSMASLCTWCPTHGLGSSEASRRLQPAHLPGLS